MVALSKAVFEDRIIDTRATSGDSVIKFKRQLAAKDAELGKKQVKIAKLTVRLELAEESIAEYAALKRECKQLTKEIEDQRERNATLLQMSRDKEVDNTLSIFSRAGPPESASKVSHQLRELFLGKISEEKSRTGEVKELMVDLESEVDCLRTKLLAEVDKNIRISAEK